MANNTGTFFNINDNDGIPLVGVSTDGKVMINHLYGNCLIGSTSVTGTAAQPLQVTGGAYVSENLGIGTTNPTSKLTVQGDGRFTGVVTASSFVGSLTGTASTANNVSSTININTSGIITATSFTGSLTGTASTATTANNVSSTININTSGIITATSFTGSLTGTASTATTALGLSTTANINNPTGIITASQLNSTGDVSVSGLTTTNNLYVAGVGTFLSSGLKIRNAANSFQYNITGGAITANRTLNLPAITGTDTVATLGSDQTFSVAQTFSSTFTHSATNTDFVAGSYTTGAVTIGGPSQTGTMTLGQSTVSQITNIQAGASGVGTTKTINLGTSGLTSSFTQINIGPTAGVGTVIINSGTNLLVGTTTATGTAPQPLQVTGGAYVSGNLGIGTTNPGVKLDVFGEGRFTKVITPEINSGGANYVYFESSGILVDSDSYFDSNVGIGTVNPTSKLHVGAATTSAAGGAPLKIGAGTTILTTPEVGAIEYDGSYLYQTPNSTSGRAYVPPVYSFRLTANGANIGATIADFFATPSSLSLEASSVYKITCFAYFTKTTAGTATWTHTFSSAPTIFTSSLTYSPVTGIANGTQTNVLSYSGGQSTASMAHAATASLTTGVNHFSRFELIAVTSAATNWRLRLTQSAGTATPLAGSYYTIEKVGPSTGTFVA